MSGMFFHCSKMSYELFDICESFQCWVSNFLTQGWFCISFMCLSVFTLFLMLFTFCGSLWLICISLSPFLKIVLLSSKSHSMLTSSGYVLASLNMDLKWLCYFFSWYDYTSLICWSFELLMSLAIFKLVFLYNVLIRLISSLLVLAVSMAVVLIDAFASTSVIDSFPC